MTGNHGAPSFNRYRLFAERTWPSGERPPSAKESATGSAGGLLASISITACASCLGTGAGIANNISAVVNRITIKPIEKWNLMNGIFLCFLAQFSLSAGSLAGILLRLDCQKGLCGRNFRDAQVHVAMRQ